MFIFTYHAELNCCYVVGISAVVWTATRIGADVLPSATLQVFFLRFMLMFLGLGVYFHFSAISQLELMKLKYGLPGRPLPSFTLDVFLARRRNNETFDADNAVQYALQWIETILQLVNQSPRGGVTDQSRNIRCANANSKNHSTENASLTPEINTKTHKSVAFHKIIGVYSVGLSPVTGIIIYMQCMYTLI